MNKKDEKMHTLLRSTQRKKKSDVAVKEIVKMYSQLLIVGQLLNQLHKEIIKSLSLEQIKTCLELPWLKYEISSAVSAGLDA